MKPQPNARDVLALAGGRFDDFSRLIGKYGCPQHVRLMMPQDDLSGLRFDAELIAQRKGKLRQPPHIVFVARPVVPFGGR
jgi:hypothetical protein